MCTPKPTPPMIRALDALAADSEGRMDLLELYQAMRATARGRTLILSRMESRGWIQRLQNHCISITQQGRAALHPPQEPTL